MLAAQRTKLGANAFWLHKFKTMAKKKTISAQTITDAYMAHVLTHNEKPKSVFAFAEANGMKEADFYQFYASFEV